MTAIAEPLLRWQCPVCGKRYLDKQMLPYLTGVPYFRWACCCVNGRTGEHVHAIQDEEAGRKLAIERAGGKLLAIQDCPRCGGFHEDMTFERVENPTDRWGWKAMCPATQQDVLLSVTPPNPGLPMPSEMRDVSS